jgi:probable F420-dependent oxidoreductase
VELGFAVPTTGSWATPANQVALSRRAEELGYASLWTFQRLLFPADAAGGRWQPVYRSVADPLVTLAFLAGHTSRARLGVAVLNLPWFSPILLAKQAASLDIVSGGRLDLGLGLGWAKQEYDAAGVPMERRGARADEFLACLDALWATDGPVEFHGELYDVAPSYVLPRPVQQPHPPVLLGGTAEAALRRAGRASAGWISSSGQDLRSIGTAIDVVRSAAREAGRDPASLRFVSRGVVRLREAGLPDRRPLSGSLDEIRADLDVLAGQGVTETFLDLNFDSQVGTVDADAVASVRRGHEVLEALAPGPG